MLSHVTGFDRIDLSSASLSGEEGQDAGASADVQDDLALEVDGVVEDGLLIRGRANVVLHHVLLLREQRVELEVLHGRRLVRSLVEERVTLAVADVR